MTTAQDQQSRAEFPSGIAAASVLRAMAMNYRAGHLWDALDERACINAANEIDRLKAELQAARALPAGEPVAWIDMGAWPPIRWLEGKVRADFRPLDGMALYTAAQVQAMGRVPPGHVAVPVEPTSKQVVLMAGAILQQQHGTGDTRHPCWPQAVEQAEKAYRAAIDFAPRPPAAPKVPTEDTPSYLAQMFGPGPRPPAAPTTGAQAATAGAGSVTTGAAQEMAQLRKAAQEALELLEYVKKAPRDAGFIDWQAGVVEQQLRSALNEPAAHGTKEGGSNAG